MTFFIIFKIRFHVRYLNVRFIRIQSININNIRIFNYVHIWSKTFRIKILQIKKTLVHKWGDDTHLKSTENSEATMTQLAKIFKAKRFCISDRNATFIVLFRFLFTMIGYKK